MNKSIIIIAFSLLFVSNLSAQTEKIADSLNIKSMDEVTIKSYFDANARYNKLKSKDGQARTERLLNALPGIGIISRGNFAQEPIIRGLSDGQIFVTINGMKIFGACTDRMDPASSYIEPNNLQAIKLYNGPGIESGGATVGGSFNFQLKKPIVNAPKPIEASAGVGFETNAQSRQLLANMQYSSKKWALYANGIYRKAGNYTPGGNVKDIVNRYGIWTKENGFLVDNNARILFSQFEKWNLGFSAVYQPNSRHEFMVDYIHDMGKNIGYPALTMDVGIANANIASVSHNYKSQYGALESWETKLYFNHIYHAMDDTKRPPEQLIMHMDMPGYSHTGGFFSKVAWKKTHHRLQAKIENYINRWHADMTMYANTGNFTMYMITIPDAQRGVTGVDVEDDIHLSDKFQMKVGSRAELNTSSIFSAKGLQQLAVIYDKNVARNNFLWNAYWQPYYKLSSKLSISVKLAKAQRAATLKELYSVYLFNRVDGFEYIGNPALKNETAYQTEFSILYQTLKFYASLKGYSHFFNNYIAAKIEAGYSATMGSYGVKRCQNISTARLIGAESMLNYTPNNQWSISSTHTYQKGTDANHNAMPMISPYRTTNKIEWEPRSTWSVYAESVFAAAQKNASPFYGEKPTPSFHIINVGVVKSIYSQSNRIVISATVNNMFNAYYYEHIDVIKLPRQGRNTVLHATIYF